MKSLLILRHAKSSWNEPGISDHDRPLNARGKRDAPRMGRLIKQLLLTPDLILSSTARRARKTAGKVADQCGCQAEVQPVDSFYLASPDAYLRQLREQDDRRTRLMVVGHNPGLEELLKLLTGFDETLPTAALAHVELPLEHWQQLDFSTPGKLAGLWRPREIDEDI